MKSIYTTPYLGILTFLLTLFCTPELQAEQTPRWAVAAKGGYFVPNIENWEAQNGSKGDNIVGLSLSYRLFQNLDFGLEGLSFSAKGKATTKSGKISGTDQQYKLYPLQAFLVYKLDFAKNQAVVPYVGGGYNTVLYKVEVDGQKTITGRQAGYHFRAGFRFLLDLLDPDSAQEAQVWGLMNSYFFLEAQYLKIDDFGGTKPDIGGWLYSSGLRYEF